jgi:hypothetical protein
MRLYVAILADVLFVANHTYTHVLSRQQEVRLQRFILVRYCITSRRYIMPPFQCNPGTTNSGALSASPTQDQFRKR